MTHPIEISGAVITMYDKREHLSREVAKNIRAIFRTTCSRWRCRGASRSPRRRAFRKPIILYRPDSPGAQAYERLAEEVMAEEVATVDAGQALAGKRKFRKF